MKQKGEMQKFEKYQNVKNVKFRVETERLFTLFSTFSLMSCPTCRCQALTKDGDGKEEAWGLSPSSATHCHFDPERRILPLNATFKNKQDPEKNPPRA